MPLEPGLNASVERTVGDADTAAAVGSGDVPVLATPTVVALCEAAAVAAVAPVLEAGQTTVGIRVELDHIAPSAVGSTVVARADLVHVDRRSLRFTIRASDGAGTIAEGMHVRLVVDQRRFIENAASR